MSAFFFSFSTRAPESRASCSSPARRNASAAGIALGFASRGWDVAVHYGESEREAA